jgi:hypothetical protein
MAPPPRPSPPSLTTEQVRRLVWLRQTVRLAPTARDRRDAIHRLVDYADQLTADGATWRSVAAAAGVSQRSLLSWRRTPRPPQLPDPTRVLPRPIAPLLPGSATTHLRVGQPEPRPPAAEARIIEPMTRLAEPARAECVILDRPRPVIEQPLRAELTPIGITRRILAVTGDTRPGGNHFGLEIARVRSIFELTAIDYVERACVKPDELVRLLHEKRPAVLHLSAHSKFSAVSLTVAGEPAWIDHADLGVAIAAAPAPRLTVLNVCSALRLAGSLTGWCAAVLYWPAEVTDDQASHYSEALYQGLAAGLTLSVSTRAAAARLAPWPDLIHPKLIGNPTRPIF